MCPSNNKLQMRPMRAVHGLGPTGCLRNAEFGLICPAQHHNEAVPVEPAGVLSHAPVHQPVSPLAAEALSALLRSRELQCHVRRCPHGGFEFAAHVGTTMLPTCSDMQDLPGKLLPDTLGGLIGNRLLTSWGLLEGPRVVVGVAEWELPRGKRLQWAPTRSLTPPLPASRAGANGGWRSSAN